MKRSKKNGLKKFAKTSKNRINMSNDGIDVNFDSFEMQSFPIASQLIEFLILTVCALFYGV